MKSNTQTSNQRLNEIRLRINKIVTKNRKEVGQGHTFQAIEEGLMGDLLSLGRLLMEDRVIEEEKSLESKGYEIEVKKN